MADTIFTTILVAGGGNLKAIDNGDGTYSVAVAVRPIAAVGISTGVAIGAGSTPALALNEDRRFAVFVNDSDETIYLNLTGTAVMNQGIRLNANGGSYEINSTNLYTGIVTAICASGAKNLCVTEG